MSAPLLRAQVFIVHMSASPRGKSVCHSFPESLLSPNSVTYMYQVFNAYLLGMWLPQFFLYI